MQKFRFPPFFPSCGSTKGNSSYLNIVVELKQRNCKQLQILRNGEVLSFRQMDNEKLFAFLDHQKRFLLGLSLFPQGKKISKISQA